ncbi:unnamed protein product [Caenorhabditis bovis]|uniref:Uncharacterized protein n=1 Tax=Caenorhabditis bovis TaxID=2654633 RepID=A0A8S1EX45_9PELO|nr:unnamed protein product [Caenorhabditis bovis]
MSSVMTQDSTDVSNAVKLLRDTTKNREIVDRSGLRIRFSGLLPISEPDEQDRVWAASIVLNSEDLEFPKISYKLRASTKKRFKEAMKSNRPIGLINQKEVKVISYEIVENAIPFTTLTFLVDGSPYDVPLFKEDKADYYWIGKETKVPTASQLYEQKQSQQISAEKSPKHISPGRFENLPEGLKNYLLEKDGLKSICRLLAPFTKEVFKELAECENPDLNILNGGEEVVTDLIADEILRKFDASVRQSFGSA